MKVYIVVRITEEFARIQVSPKYSNYGMALDSLRFFQQKHPSKTFLLVEQIMDFGVRPKLDA